MSGLVRGLALAVGAGAAGLQLVHAHRNWGATDEEAATTLAGDELVPEPADQQTLAVSVDALPQEIWAWLVQMGQGRGGMYSYDWMENLINLDIHSTDEIREEWQHLAVGDRVTVVPEGYGPLPAGYSFRVALVDAPHSLVLRQAPPEHPWNGVWSFHVRPAGTAGCRLLARSRTQLAPQLGLRIATRVGEPVTLVMTRRMLHGIRERAEAEHRRRAPAPVHPRRLAAIKAVHTAAWASIEFCVAYLLWAGARGHTDRRAAAAAAVVAAECLVFVGDGFHCPLTALAERAGASSGSVTDIYLPRWFAKSLPAIHLPLLVLIGWLHRRALSRGGER